MDVRNTAPTSRPVMPSITVVPETRVLTFQVCGGIRGCELRRSMTVNADNRAADTLSPTRVRIDVQPLFVAPPRANISAMRPPRAVAAPGRSNWDRPACSGRLAGRVLYATARATMPIGTLIQKIACQPAHVVSAPPTRTPPATPRLPTAPHRARPFRRWAPL